MSKLIKLVIVGAFLVAGVVAPLSTANASHNGCEVWYDDLGFCYYSCPGHGDGYC